MDLYQPRVEQRLVMMTDRCGSTASRNTPPTAKVASQAFPPRRRRSVDPVEALVVAASKGRPMTTFPMMYKHADAPNITTTSANGRGLEATSVNCSKICTGVIV